MDSVVARDLQKLFGVKNPEEIEKFIRIVRKEVWTDTYKGHLKFIAELKKYYG